MDFMKVCMGCGNEFTTNQLLDNTLICPRCLSGDVYQEQDIKYDEITLEDCIEYFKNKISCVCNADDMTIYFEGEN